MTSLTTPVRGSSFMSPVARSTMPRYRWNCFSAWCQKFTYNVPPRMNGFASGKKPEPSTTTRSVRPVSSSLSTA